MPLVHITTPSGETVQLEVPLQSSIMRAAVDARVEGIIGECGGAAMCGTCHVLIDPEWANRLPPMRQNEDELLDCTSAPRQPTSRLGCQLRMTADMEGLVLRMPTSQR